MPQVGFEHTISAGERPRSYALDRATTGTDEILECVFLKLSEIKFTCENICNIAVTYLA
jgi:hypothetical protein